MAFSFTIANALPRAKNSTCSSRPLISKLRFDEQGLAFHR